MLKDLFKGSLSRKMFLTRYVLSLAYFFAGVYLLGLISKNDTAVADSFMLVFLWMFFVTYIYQISLDVRRLRDAGKNPFLALLSTIILLKFPVFIYLLLAPSETRSESLSDNGEQVKKSLFPRLSIYGLIILLLFIGMYKLKESSLHSLNTLRSRVSPEIYELLSLSYLSPESVEKIISLQKSYSYDETIWYPPCDPGMTCDGNSLKPTTKEKFSRYFKTGSIDSEIHYHPEDEYKDLLIDQLRNDRYKYGCFFYFDKEDVLSVYFISEDRKKTIEIIIENAKDKNKQYIDGIYHSSVLTYFCH